MKKLIGCLASLCLSTWVLAIPVDFIPPQSVNNGNVTLSSATASGNTSGIRHCLTNLAVDLPNPVNVAPVPCQFAVRDAGPSGTVLWSVYVTTNAPSAISQWNIPYALCSGRNNQMTVTTTCPNSDISLNGYEDK